MRAGQLDRRIALQRSVNTLSSSGSPIENWSTLVTIWSEVSPLTGVERNASEQWVAREQVKFTIRWSLAVADLSPLDQVVFPSDDASVSPTPPRSVYDIMAVNEKGRHESLIILAARRVG